MGLWSLLKENKHPAAEVEVKCLTNKQIASPTQLHSLPRASGSQTTQKSHNNPMPVHQHYTATQPLLPGLLLSGLNGKSNGEHTLS